VALAFEAYIGECIKRSVPDGRWERSVIMIRSRIKIRKAVV